MINKLKHISRYNKKNTNNITTNITTNNEEINK